MTTRDTEINRKPDPSSHSSWNIDRSYFMGIAGGVAAGVAYPVGLVWGVGIGAATLLVGSGNQSSRRAYFTRSGVTAAAVAGAMAFSSYNATPQPPELYMNDTHTVITVPMRGGEKEFVRDGDRFMLREDYITHHERLVSDRKNASLDSLLATENR